MANHGDSLHTPRVVNGFPQLVLQVSAPNGGHGPGLKSFKTHSVAMPAIAKCSHCDLSKSGRQVPGSGTVLILHGEQQDHLI